MWLESALPFVWFVVVDAKCIWAVEYFPPCRFCRIDPTEPISRVSEGAGVFSCATELLVRGVCLFVIDVRVMIILREAEKTKQEQLNNTQQHSTRHVQPSRQTGLLSVVRPGPGGLP